MNPRETRIVPDYSFKSKWAGKWIVRHNQQGLLIHILFLKDTLGPLQYTIGSGLTAWRRLVVESREEEVMV